MPEVVADHGEIDAGLEQSHCTAVSQNVRRDVFATKRRQLPNCELEVLAKEMSGTVSAERTSSGAAKDRGVSGKFRVVDETLECLGGVWPQRTDPIFAPLSVQTHLMRSCQLDFVTADRQRFADPRPCVVEE